MILIVGATGQLGRRVARRLRGMGQPVRALCRTTADATVVGALRKAGVECIGGDLCDPDSLVTACCGVEVVVSTASGISRPHAADSLDAVDRQGHFNLLQAAEEAGVQRFIYVSFAMPASFHLDFPMWHAKRAVEQRLRTSELEYTIFHPTPFMESWLTPAAGFDYVGGTVQLVGEGRNAVSFISVEDVAHNVAAAVYHPRAKNRVLALGGPGPATWLEAVARTEQATGRKFQIKKVPMETVQAQFEQADDPKLRSILALTLGVAGDWVVDPADTADALGLTVSSWTTLDDYVRHLV